MINFCCFQSQIFYIFEKWFSLRLRPSSHQIRPWFPSLKSKRCKNLFRLSHEAGCHCNKTTATYASTVNWGAFCSSLSASTRAPLVLERTRIWASLVFLPPSFPDNGLLIVVSFMKAPSEGFILSFACRLWRHNNVIVHVKKQPMTLIKLAFCFALLQLRRKCFAR